MRVNGLDTGLTDADLDGVVAGRARTPSCCRRPKAARRSSISTPSSTAREAIAGLPEGAIKILALATETAAGAVPRRHLSRLQARG